jgi:hypothetical protein
MLGGLDGLFDQFAAHMGIYPIEDRSQRRHDRQPQQPPCLLARQVTTMHPVQRWYRAVGPIATRHGHIDARGVDGLAPSVMDCGCEGSDHPL